jgi:hypothetical protein
MLIKRKSPLTGEENSREINVTEEQLLAWNNGMLIQNAMPDLSPDDREFIMMGTTPEMWNKIFPPEENLS